MTAGKAYLSSLFVVALGSAVIVRGTKDKTDFYTHTGRITYLADHYRDLPNQDRALVDRPGSTTTGPAGQGIDQHRWWTDLPQGMQFVPAWLE